MTEPSRFSQCRFLGRHNKETFPAGLGLGDYVSKTLEKIWITKERFAKLIGEYDETIGCIKCKKKESLMNFLGKKLGLPTGQGSDLRAVLENLTLDKQPMYKCEIHGTCIGRQTFNEKIYDAIRLSNIMPCMHCSDGEPKNIE